MPPDVFIVDSVADVYLDAAMATMAVELTTDAETHYEAPAPVTIELVMSGHGESAERAIAQGFTVVQSTEQTLLIDLDFATDLPKFERTLAWMQNYLPLRETDRWRSKSGRGWHIVVESTEEMSPVERLLLQACLGSDLRREFYGLLHARQGYMNPSMLFRPQGSTQ